MSNFTNNQQRYPLGQAGPQGDQPLYNPPDYHAIPGQNGNRIYMQPEYPQQPQQISPQTNQEQQNQFHPTQQPQQPAYPNYQVETPQPTSQPASNEEPAQEKMSFLRKWGTLLVLSLALCIIVIDTTLLNVSISTLITELNTNLDGIQWVITAYSLTLAAFTITGGRLGDLFGRKKMFVLGAVIFAVGSFIASISNNLPTMLLGESFIEGIGAALMMPATSSLLITTFKGRERAMAFGVWGGVAAGASAVGPILGGFLTTYYSWRWGFRINVVVASILVIGSLWIRESKNTHKKATIDWAGIGLSAAGLLIIVFSIIESSRFGWLLSKKPFLILGKSLGDFSIIPFTLLIGLLVFTVFILWEIIIEEHKEATPLISIRMFLNKQFSSGLFTTTMMALGQSGIIFSVPIFLQAVRNTNAFDTGLALLPLSISLFVASPLSAFLSSKIKPKLIILFGLFFNIIGLLVISQTMAVDSTVASFIPGLVIYGIGSGLVMAQISNLTLSAVPVSEAGEASGVNSTARQIGSSLGYAIIGAILLSTLASNFSTSIKNSTKIPDQIKNPIVEKINEDPSNFEFNSSMEKTTSLPPDIQNELNILKNISVTESIKYSLYAAIAFIFFALLAAAEYLPDVKSLEPRKGPTSGH